MAIMIVSGNVGFSDFKYSPQGTAILTVSIADHRYNYKEGEEETVWIRAVWFGERAEKLANSIMKAKTIQVTGRENYKIYNEQIDRSIEPIDHQILSFKPQENQAPMNHTTSYQPPSDNDLPFYNG